MNLPSDQPTKSKITAGSRRARRADRLATIRLRAMIWRTLNERDITMPSAIASAVGMPAIEAAKLLTGRVWREGDVVRLEAVAARLGAQVPGQ
jgi:hypothetical protein